MKKIKRISAVISAITAAAVAALSTGWDECSVSGADEREIIPESSTGTITIYPDKTASEISPYIYGINDKGDMEGVTATVVKLSGAEISSYNWETNFANGGTDGKNRHIDYPEKAYSAGDENAPGKLADNLYVRSLTGNSPMRLLTLQMMGYAAADGSGVVSSDELSRNTRWKKVLFSKEDTYLNKPDTKDNFVYTDEYVSYLVNRYGSANEGGMNGYLLDSEPDRWAERFSVLGLEKVTPEELVSRSVELSSSVKTIDSEALIFAPSLSGLQGCINLNNQTAWNNRSGADKEYSWFIDYYLASMRKREEDAGVRLLDVLDVHYFTEATTPMGVSVLTGSGDEARAYRMQSVRTLWDSDYTENSPTVLLNKQFTPLIPTLQASIRINYPGTKLSFSEYDFGGGDDMSGAIAQIDALGTFAKEEVYLACLSPVSTDYSFQKAAINLFNNYDGSGSGFGSKLIQAENGGSSMNSVYAAADTENPETVRVIVTNKNLINPQEFEIDLQTVRYSYTVTSAYTIDENAEIIPCDAEMFSSRSDNTISFEAPPLSAYLLVLSGSEEHSEVPAQTSETASESVTADTEATESMTAPSETVTSADSSVPENTGTAGSDSSIAVSSGDVNDDAVSDGSESGTTSISETLSESYLSEDPDDFSEAAVTDSPAQSGGVAMPVKVIVSALAAAVGLGVVYVLFFDRKK
ncbi:MAG: hypothetical protein K2N72_04060 [Oscillospiraceae bacterium]|nr:hypothetical protein [Oscillospiraceae bacterium]